MSKYDPLSRRFDSTAEPEWRTSFAEIEGLLGFALPKGARAHAAWWRAGPEKAHGRAWADHGWEVADIDHRAETVLFRKVAAGRGSGASASEIQPAAMREAALRAARGRSSSWVLGLAALVGAGLALWGVERRRRR